MLFKKLKLIIGPMFSGKTTHLISHITNFQHNHAKGSIFCLNSMLDIRYGTRMIVSHDNRSVECNMSDSNGNICQYISTFQLSEFNLFAIDEGQFIDDIDDFCKYYLDDKIKHNIIVVVVFLKSDFLQNVLGKLGEMVAMADEIVNLKAECRLCHRDAVHTIKITKGETKIEIGDKQYEPRCRDCLTK